MLSSLHSLCALHKIGDGFKLNGGWDKYSLKPSSLNNCHHQTSAILIRGELFIL